MSDNNPSSTGFKADVNHEALLQTVSFMFFFGFTVLLWKIFYQYFTEKTRGKRLICQKHIEAFNLMLKTLHLIFYRLGRHLATVKLKSLLRVFLFFFNRTTDQLC